MQRETLETFKVMVVNENQLNKVNIDLADHGLILDFDPTEKQTTMLKKVFKPLNVRTLFTKEQRETLPLELLLAKQILHYVETYGFGLPGDFTAEVEGKAIVVTYIKGVTVAELGGMIVERLETNAPVKDAKVFVDMVNHYGIDFDINTVANNELRVMLFDVNKHRFENGDDAVRWLCWYATGDGMLIKSPEVIDAISQTKVPHVFLERHMWVLSEVFNRHKKLILAAKNQANRTVINQISRLSKKTHKPLHEPFSKRFLSVALGGKEINSEALDKLTVRDKFKMLNLLKYKALQRTEDLFVIRNGKVFLRQDRQVHSAGSIKMVENMLLDSLYRNIWHLIDKRILLDPNVDYGLPISRKQSVGHLPFGTTVKVDSDKIVSGIYWENDWGAYDLDLSAITLSGMRTGWGQLSGYTNHKCVFSGDVTNATDGAMEFFTSDDQTYGLFVNIYNGQTPSGMELVVGSGNNASRRWLESPIIREKYQLMSRGTLVGFVHNKTFMVYAGRLNGSSISNPKQGAMVARGLSGFWTVKALFDRFGIKYDVSSDGEPYDHDLTYSGFTFETVEKLFA